MCFCVFSPNYMCSMASVHPSGGDIAFTVVVIYVSPSVSGTQCSLFWLHESYFPPLWWFSWLTLCGSHRRTAKSEMHFIHSRKGQLPSSFQKFFLSHKFSLLSFSFVLPSRRRSTSLLYCSEREVWVERMWSSCLWERSNRKNKKSESGIEERRRMFLQRSMLLTLSKMFWDKRKQNEWKECTLLLGKRKTWCWVKWMI